MLVASDPWEGLALAGRSDRGMAVSGTVVQLWSNALTPKVRTTIVGILGCRNSQIHKIHEQSGLHLVACTRHQWQL